MIRVRIAPSPTGYFHFGTARTALFNWLYARSKGGQFIVRIEDTDRERSTPAYEEDILDSLRWLGLQWDEGPDVGGPCAPYRQRERIQSYQEALKRLESQGMIYRCTCTPAMLEAERNEAQHLQKPYRYSRRCRAPSPQPRFSLQGKEDGEGSDQWVFRFAAPAQGATHWIDLVHGSVTIAHETLDDFIIAKGWEEPLYNFAVVVDDAAMGITHVIRGEDHLSNTPKQILMAAALGYPIPQFAHIPLILNPDRTKMSKRMNEVRLSWYREQGYLPEALVNFIALLGWNPGGTQEVFSRKELIQAFTLERVQKAGAIFSLEKLQWMNAQYIKRLSDVEYLASARDYCAQFSPALLGSLLDGVVVDAVLLLAKDRLRCWRELEAVAEPFTKKRLHYDPALLRWPKSKEKPGEGQHITETIADLTGALEALASTEWNANVLETRIKEWIASTGKGTGETLWPLRVALSGLERSPSPFELAQAYGRAWTIRRLEDARALLNNASPSV